MAYDDDEYQDSSSDSGMASSSTTTTGDSYTNPTMLDVADLKKVREGLGLGDEDHNIHFNKFNRFRIDEHADFFSSGVGYVFITKPNLNFSEDNMNNDDFFAAMFRNEQPDSLGALIKKSLIADGDGFNAIKLLTNNAENFDTADVTLRQDEMSETSLGYKIVIPGLYVDSMTSGSFSINYAEHSDMSITLLHKTWVEYIHNVRTGRFKSTSEYIKSKIIDYMSSAYYFLCHPDGKSIKYYCKYTGVFPTNIPSSAFNFDLGQPKIVKLQVQYTYNFKEDLDPSILSEFNYLGSGGGTKKTNKLADNWADMPFVENGVLYWS